MPYPERLQPKNQDQQLTDFIRTLAIIQINLPLIDAIKNIPSYAKFFKDVCTKKKKLVDFEKVILTDNAAQFYYTNCLQRNKIQGVLQFHAQLEIQILNVL